MPYMSVVLDTKLYVTMIYYGKLHLPLNSNHRIQTLIRLRQKYLIFICTSKVKAKIILFWSSLCLWIGKWTHTNRSLGILRQTSLILQIRIVVEVAFIVLINEVKHEEGNLLKTVPLLTTDLQVVVISLDKIQKQNHTSWLNRVAN